VFKEEDHRFTDIYKCTYIYTCIYIPIYIYTYRLAVPLRLPYLYGPDVIVRPTNWNWSHQEFFRVQNTAERLGRGWVGKARREIFRLSWRGESQCASFWNVTGAASCSQHPSSCVCDTMLCQNEGGQGACNNGVSHRTMRLISLCVAVFAAEIQSEQDISECLSIYA